MAVIDTQRTMSYPDLAETLEMPGSTEELQAAPTRLNTSEAPTPMSTSDQATPTEREPTAHVQELPVGSLEVKLTPQAWMQAIENYAKDKGVCPSTITEDMIKASEEGPAYWSTVNQDMTARGPASQAMGRALKHRPDVREHYSVLLDNLKADFRRAWTASRSFDFAEITRQTIHTYSKRKEEVGCFKTELQIQMLLGGCDKGEAVFQASNYIRMCQKPSLKAWVELKIHFSQGKA